MTGPLEHDGQRRDLDALRSLEAAATPDWIAVVGTGPKRRKQQYALIGEASKRGTGAEGCIAVFSSTNGRRADDAELAVAARNALPWLLDEAAEAERLRTYAAEMERQRNAFGEALTAIVNGEHGGDPAEAAMRAMEELAR